MKSTTAITRRDDNTSTEDERIRTIATRISMATTQGMLGTFIAQEVIQYTLFDLQVIGGRLHTEVTNLPSPYRERVCPYFREQLFGAHHTLLIMSRTGAFRSMTSPINDRDTFLEFCAMIPEGCFAWDERAERTPFPYAPKHRLFYYLMAAFTMFVLDRPGHPVGMPFPGGFAVEDRNGTFYCLIRDREKEVFFSICNFCPAKQTEENAPIK